MLLCIRRFVQIIDLQMNIERQIDFEMESVSCDEEL